MFLVITLFATIMQDDVKPRPSEGNGGKAGTFPDDTIKVKDKEREYRLIIPKSLDLKKPSPLLFAFHGLGDSKDIMPIYSQLGLLARRENFILVFPNGLNRAWPVTKLGSEEDLAFFDALYGHITSQYNVDLNRVYLTGMSNGAYFAHVVASQRSEKIAAIAPHSGGLGLMALGGIGAKHKYAVLLIHGDADSIVPPEQSKTARDTYEKEGHKVGYVEIKGLGHFWASKERINDRIWSFFTQHPLRGQSP